MSTPSNPPYIWATSKLITPEKLNSNLLAAKTNLEDFAEQQWHKWTVESSERVSDVLIDLPTFDSSFNFSYYVDYIVVYGDYTGNPVLKWGPVGSPTGSFTLPSDKKDFSYTVLPSDLITGAATAVNYQIRLEGAGGDAMRCIVGLRTSRTNASTALTSTLMMVNQGDVLSATDFNANLTALNNFATTWTSTAAQQPFGIYYTHFKNFTFTTNSRDITDHVLGSGPEEVKQIFCRVQMDGTGSTGQTVKISAGYGAASDLAIANVDGLTVVDFSTGVLSLSDAARDPNTGADDFFISASTLGSTAVKRIEIFVLKRKLI